MCRILSLFFVQAVWFNNNLFYIYTAFFLNQLLFICLEISSAIFLKFYSSPSFFQKCFNRIPSLWFTKAFSALSTSQYYWCLNSYRLFFRPQKRDLLRYWCSVYLSFQWFLPLALRLQKWPLLSMKNWKVFETCYENCFFTWAWL